jgi:anti-sigma B factor antagonist
MKLKIKAQKNGLVLVEVSGEVVQKHLPQMKDPLAQLLGPDCYKDIVLLDLHDIQAIDSSGIGWLLVSHKRFRNQGGRLIMHSLSPFVREMMRILNMQLVFTMVEDEQSAYQAASVSQ